MHSAKPPYSRVEIRTISLATNDSDPWNSTPITTTNREVMLLTSVELEGMF